MILAALCPEDTADCDSALAGLVERLAGQGCRVVGAVQVPSAGETRIMDLRLLPGGTLLRISQDLGPAATGCRLDPGALESAAAAAEAALAAAPADLLVVNRFGRQEAEGRGFAGLIGTALAAGVPVIVGLSPKFRPLFQDFAGDLAEWLPADSAALLDWWARAQADA
ncbi:DUF2478 domain-containing protein [Frigidibacter albus]|uniref:DUF2478 domain-containing protein n=1 Tax=Frigidibacter albus TaxID=1465486 RepID=A0A6L8VIE8_9RHOB|nr:DUF2478 domain-containing protein [Frigidibacter albus]MZQ89312.1 DUF2478 domain-containing protein [Frigidibacter albus]NBE31218.1 DUF2478 domain-containing protein [Frigidibacter albus]GGH53537.1 hypothetical protein GCM10011341_19070 [Frigidibacter albus]